MENNQLILIKDLGMIYPKETSLKKKHYAIYRCYCGNEFKSRIDGVKNNNTTSCGCYRDKKQKESITTHGLHNHNLYRTWSNLKQRCYNHNNPKHKDYGLRGIKVCDEWLNDFKSFYNWSLENGYKDDLTIDRKDNDLGYSPDNCRWVIYIIQNQNTRKLRNTNSSGYRGVCFKNGKFVASISVNKKPIHIGRFNTAIQAARAYDSYVIENRLSHTINNILSHCRETSKS